MSFVRIFLLIAFVAVCEFTAVSQQVPNPAVSHAPPNDFLGRVIEGGYINRFFDMELRFPTDWKVVDAETTSAVMEIGTDYLKGDNGKSNRALEAATKREVVLFYLTRKPVGSPGNCSFIMAVLKQPHEKVLPSMVAEASKALFANSPNLKITRDTRNGKLGGKNVAMVDYELAIGDQKVSILYYVMVVKGYSISFSITFANETDRKDLERIVNSIVFGTNKIAA